MLGYRLTNLEVSYSYKTAYNEKLFKRHEQRVVFDLGLAKWLLRRGFRVECTGLYGDWQRSFRTFRYIPRNALIVEFCQTGDILNVQKMFAKRLASPHDRVAFEDDDWSLLHVS